MSDTKTQTCVPDISCQECRDLLSDYVDRELSETERNSVEHHLGVCPKCGSESTRLHGLKKVMQHWKGIEGSGTFHRTVMDQFIRESQQIPSQQFTEAAAPKGAASAAAPQTESGVEHKVLPPIWILMVAVALAVGAYYLVLFLRGG